MKFCILIEKENIFGIVGDEVIILGIRMEWFFFLYLVVELVRRYLKIYILLIKYIVKGRILYLLSEWVGFI